jgi:ribosomal protein L35
MTDDDEQKIKIQKAEKTHIESKQASKQQQQQRALKDTDVSSDAVADHLSSAFFSVASI